MFRTVLTIAVGLFFCLLSGESAYAAGYTFEDGSRMQIQWYERNGHIATRYVCFNYSSDEDKFEQCREKAVEYFREECEYYTDKVSKTKKKYADMYIPQRDMFCQASKNYKP